MSSNETVPILSLSLFHRHTSAHMSSDHMHQTLESLGRISYWTAFPQCHYPVQLILIKQKNTDQLQGIDDNNLQESRAQ